MERLGKSDRKIGTKIRGLGAVAAMFLLSGDTGQSAPPPDCAGMEIVVGGLRPREYVPTCLEELGPREGDLNYEATTNEIPTNLDRIIP